MQADTTAGDEQQTVSAATMGKGKGTDSAVAGSSVRQERQQHVQQTAAVIAVSVPGDRSSTVGQITVEHAQQQWQDTQQTQTPMQ